MKRLEVEVSHEYENPTNFQQLCIKELEQTQSRLQREQLKVSPTQASHVRLTVHEGYDHFVAIQSIKFA